MQTPHRVPHSGCVSRPCHQRRRNSKDPQMPPQRDFGLETGESWDSNIILPTMAGQAFNSMVVCKQGTRSLGCLAGLECLDLIGQAFAIAPVAQTYAILILGSQWWQLWRRLYGTRVGWWLWGSWCRRNMVTSSSLPDHNPSVIFTLVPCVIHRPWRIALARFEPENGSLPRFTMSKREARRSDQEWFSMPWRMVLLLCLKSDRRWTPSTSLCQFVWPSGKWTVEQWPLQSIVRRFVAAPKIVHQPVVWQRAETERQQIRGGYMQIH